MLYMLDNRSFLIGFFVYYNYTYQKENDKNILFLNIY